MSNRGLWFEDEDGNRIYPTGGQVGNLDTGSAPYLFVNPQTGDVYDLSAIGSGGSTTDTNTHVSTIPMTEIAAANTAVGLELHIPADKTLTVYEVGVITDAETAPAGLTVEVQDLTNAVSLVSKNAKHTEGTPTLASKGGAFAAAMRVNNGDSVTHNASGWIRWTLE